MPLNPSQARAVTESGVQLILAGPGSGKTRVITEKILHLLQNGISPSRILALTFSEKAAQEMLERLEKRTATGDLTVSTFHAFALSVLEDNVLDSGLSFSAGVISRANQLVWGLQNIDAFGFEHIKIGNNASVIIESVIDGISAFRDELISPDELEGYLQQKGTQSLSDDEREYLDKLSDLLKVYRAYERYKRSENLLDYDDMIHETVRLFTEKPHILRHYRKRFSHILVDEFQDTNYAQLQLIKQLAGDHLCVVGDDDQTIYRFRGAYLTNMQDFKDHFTHCSEILLEWNYRSTQTILDLALQLMKHAPNRQEKRLITGNPAGEPVTVADCSNESGEALFVCDEIQRLVGTPFYSRSEGVERELHYGDVAIICRRRIEGDKFFQTLKKNGIPVEFVGEVDFFAAPVIRDILAYLRAIENPLTAGISLNRIEKLNGIPETVVQKINTAARTIAWKQAGNDGVFEALQQAAAIVPDSAHLIQDILSTLNQLIERKDRVGIGALIHELLRDATDLYRRALTEETGTDLLLLKTFSQIVHDYEAIARRGTLTDFLRYLDLLSGISVEVGEREDKDAVRILTVHKSKGKEYPVVFVVDLVKDKFPLRYQAKPFSVPNDLAKGLKTGDDEKALFLQEERRLCYVAMTRAQDKLYLTLAKRYGERKTDAKPSQFLEELHYQNNPLIRITKVITEEKENPDMPDNPVDTLKREIRDQAHRAIEQMHLATAVQRIVDLEKIRMLEEHKGLDTFDPAAFVSLPADDAALIAAFAGKPQPLIGPDHHFSASALRKYQDCPLGYKFQYVLQVPTVQKTYFSMGTAVHTVIELLSKNQVNGSAPTRESALHLLDSCWSSQAYASHTQETEDRRKAETMLDTYLLWQAANPNTIIEAEKKFQFVLNGRKIKGFIDRIERTQEGEYIVVDFKTGTKPSSLTKNSVVNDIQLNLYCVAIREMFGQLPQRASFYYIKEDKMVDYYPTEETIGAFEEVAKDIITAVCSEQFDPAPSYQNCRFCDYADLCEKMESAE
ncbi:MAG: ATP-dependent helicase [Methanomicrobiales archaeon]|nr:ATP-dependent helicase [Methanomicrobiales archaeon]